MTSSRKLVYIQGDRDVEVTHPDVTLGDILKMECADRKILPGIKTIRSGSGAEGHADASFRFSES